MPSASAAAVSTFRRGLRANESLTMRKNIVRESLVRNSAPGFGERRDINHQRAIFRSRGNADRIAPTRFSDRWNVDGGSAVAADYVRAVLAVAGRAADQA